MIPDFQTAMLPLLQQMNDEKIYDSTSLRNVAVSYFKITDDGIVNISSVPKYPKFI